MYRDAKASLDERDRAVGAILIGEALITSCERAQVLGETAGPSAWRAIRDAHDDFPERDDQEWLKHSLSWCGEDGAVRLGYRPVRMQTLTNEVSVFPPKKRVY